jgi:hypothetical protein
MPVSSDFESLLDHVPDFGTGGKSDLSKLQVTAVYASEPKVSA